MSYDEKTGTITTDGDRKQFERDLFAHFEFVAKDLANQPNAAPEAIEYHKKLEAANRAIANAEHLKALSAVAAFTKRRPLRPQSLHEALLRHLKNPTRKTRLAAVGVVTWTAYVLYRTLGDHELLGIDLYAWDSSAFLSNWLMVPAIVSGLLYAMKWAVGGKIASSKAKPNRIAEFERLITSWPADQARRGLLLLKAALSGSTDELDRIAQHMSINQVQAVGQVLQAIEEDELAKNA